MAATTSKVLRMTFENAGGRTFNITMPEPREDLTSSEIETAMDLIIDRNIFSTSGGDLVAKRDIKIIDTITDDLYDPPRA
ncbi:MAG TPA: DUF2922 domain-containing protein [Peptococcaceae bacterium]|nr:DUF2922 domain-containing protein [Peptococcaceae bacterium]